jgi:alkylhydroperoxidase family enzyme
MDTNAVGSSTNGASAEKIEALAYFESSDLFTPAEKVALRLAEAMSQTPAVISDPVFAAAREHYSEAQLVELAATAAMENYRARFNRVFGVESQGFYQRRLTSTS